MQKKTGWLRNYAMVLVCLAAGQAAANDVLLRELDLMQRWAEQKRFADVSDRADSANYKRLVAQTTTSTVKERALWEAANYHLEAANGHDASPNNAYARRAIEAWTAYVDFATDQGADMRLVSAVEFLQRSYVQARDFAGMFGHITALPHKYVNHNVVTRWEDRLKTCSEYGATARQTWVEQSCSTAECRQPVGDFYSYMQQWLGEFPLKAEARTMFSQRASRVPKACRAN